jgi:dCMP deaminase
MSKWGERYLEMAYMVAGWSKDPSTKVGSVIVRPDNTVASLGFNGFPRGCRDDESLLNDREEKYARTIHGELNAILNARGSVDGCTLYVTHPPCSSCAAALIQAGITRVIYKKPSQDLLTRWGESIERATNLLKEARVMIVERE